jgi:hypothetical protein
MSKIKSNERVPENQRMLKERWEGQKAQHKQWMEKKR